MFEPRFERSNVGKLNTNHTNKWANAQEIREVHYCADIMYEYLTIPTIKICIAISEICRHNAAK